MAAKNSRTRKSRAAEAGTNSVSLTRRFEAAPERVFDAWIDPAENRHWLFTLPSSVKHTVQLEAHAGGTYTITDRREGKDYTAVGEYLEVTRPSRLVFTFGMPQFSPDFDRITVDVVADGAGCSMTLTQQDLRTGYLKSTRRGWSKMLDALAARLAHKSGPGAR